MMNPKPVQDIKQRLLKISRSQLENFNEFREKVDVNADEVFKIVRSKSDYSLSRGRIVGGVGLRTSIETNIKNQSQIINHTQPDFELVIFVNNESPPFEHVLQDFEKALVSHKCKKHNFIFESKTSHSAHFHMKDVTKPRFKGVDDPLISFEIIPAINLLSSQEEENCPTETSREQVQTERALKWISELPETKRSSSCYNGALAEAYISFVDSQSKFVHDMIRLAKLWDRKVAWKWDEKLIDRSMLIELSAISSAVVEEKDARKAKRDKSLSCSMQTFLNKFIYFDRLMHELFKEQLTATPNLEFYYEKFVEKKYPSDVPVLLNPVNPFHNVAANLNDEMKDAFMVHAKVTLSAIRNYKRFNSGRWFNLEGYFGV